MNYLGHSLPFVHRDDGAFLVAGTSLPDWLRVIDKRARLRPEVLDAVVVDNDERFAALRDGARRHLADDRAFHQLAAFDDVAHDLSAQLRALDGALRAATLGHVLTEMLLDAALMDDDAQLLDRYYAHLDRVDESAVAAFARRATGRPLEHAEHLVDRFRRARFLADYRDDDGLLNCLVGVCRRAGLAAPPRAARVVVAVGRARVRALAASVRGAA